MKYFAAKAGAGVTSAAISKRIKRRIGHSPTFFRTRSKKQEGGKPSIQGFRALSPACRKAARRRPEDRARHGPASARRRGWDGAWPGWQWRRRHTAGARKPAATRRRSIHRDERSK